VRPHTATWPEACLLTRTESGELEYLSRNKEMQARYIEWIGRQKEIWGSSGESSRVLARLQYSRQQPISIYNSCGLIPENYLINARLPWNNAAAAGKPCEPTYDQRTALDYPDVDLTPSTNPHPRKKTSPGPIPPAPGAGSAAVAAYALGQFPRLGPRDGASGDSQASQSQASASPTSHVSQVSHAATAASTPAGSGASTPNSVAYVPLESVLPRVNRVLARRRASRRRDTLGSAAASEAGEASEPGSGELEIDDDEVEQLGRELEAELEEVMATGGDAIDPNDPDDPAHDVFLRWEGDLDPEKFAVLPNDWPYCVPYGVRHYCVWSRVSGVGS
jgi:hypothetical protein